MAPQMNAAPMVTDTKRGTHSPHFLNRFQAKYPPTSASATPMIATAPPPPPPPLFSGALEGVPFGLFVGLFEGAFAVVLVGAAVVLFFGVKVLV